MALEIVATELKPITINGTTITVPSVYAKLEFIARADGKTMEIATLVFQNSAMFAKGIVIACDIELENIHAVCDSSLQEKQTIETAEKYAKLHFLAKGYLVNLI